MKKKTSLLLAFLLAVSMFAAVPTVYADAPTTVNITSGLDLTQWGNAMRVYFDQNITNSTTNTTMVNVQAMQPSDPNYNEAVVNGVLDGILIDGKTVRAWNSDSMYGIMVHYYLSDSEYFIAVYADAGLVDFADGNSHTVVVTSKFKSYNADYTNGSSLKLNPSTMQWNKSKIEITSGLDLTQWGNAMRVYFDKNITNSMTDVTMVNVQALGTSDPNYDRTVVLGVLDGIMIDGKTVREWNISSDYSVMVHFYLDAGSYFAAIYVDSTMIDFKDGLAHTVSLKNMFKNYSMDSATDTTLYLSPETMVWSTTAPLPTTNVVGGDSRETFDWGNTMRVLFDKQLWIPDPAATSPEKDLLVDAQNLVTGNKYYNADAVNSILNKILIDGKTVSEWNALAVGNAQVHVGPSEMDLRIYMKDSAVVFGDGNTHIITIEKNYISFSGYKTSEAVSLHYDPTSKTWGTTVIIPPTPTPGEPVESFTATPLLMSGNFGTVYFYMTNVITRAATINVQAGGGKIPETVKNAVLDLIRIDGKTVREWNLENDTDYAVMIAYESEVSGAETFGRLSIWADTTSTCKFTPDVDHTVEFLDGLIGLNDAPIAAQTWQYSASEQEWYLEDAVTDPTPTQEEENEITPTPVTTSDDESPSTSDSGTMPMVIISIVALSALIILVRKKYSYSI